MEADIAGRGVDVAGGGLNVAGGGVIGREIAGLDVAGSSRLDIAGGWVVKLEIAGRGVISRGAAGLLGLSGILGTVSNDLV